MPTFLVNDRELGQQVRTQGAAATAKALGEALQQGELKLHDFSIRSLAANLVTNKDGSPVGRSFIDGLTSLSEAAAQAVQADAFAQINGQIFYNAVLEGYEEAETAISKEFGVVNSTNLRGERFGGVSNIALPLPVIPESNEYPPLQPSANYIDSPAQLKKGYRVEITREALMMDRTAELLERCKAVGKALGVDRELEAVACLTDVVGLTNAGGTPTAGTGTARTRYNWLGSSYATYQASTPWINNKLSNALADQSNLNNANILLDQMLDPFTQLPIDIKPEDLCLVVPPSLKFTAERIQSALQLRTVGGYAGTTNMAPMLVSDGRPPVPFKIISSKYLYLFNSLNSLPTTTWFWGSLKGAFRFVRGLDITVSEALPGSHYLWSHDVVQAFKGGKIETAYTWDPRYVVKNLA